MWTTAGCPWGGFLVFKQHPSAWLKIQGHARLSETRRAVHWTTVCLGYDACRRTKWPILLLSSSLRCYIKSLKTTLNSCSFSWALQCWRLLLETSCNSPFWPWLPRVTGGPITCRSVACYITALQTSCPRYELGLQEISAWRSGTWEYGDNLISQLRSTEQGMGVVPGHMAVSTCSLGDDPLSWAEGQLSEQLSPEGALSALLPDRNKGHWPWWKQLKIHPFERKSHSLRRQ